MKDFSSLPEDAEGIVIGNECLQDNTLLPFSLYKNVTVIDIGFRSLTNVWFVDLNSRMIDD